MASSSWLHCTALHLHMFGFFHFYLKDLLYHISLSCTCIWYFCSTVCAGLVLGLGFYFIFYVITLIALVSMLCPNYSFFFFLFCLCRTFLWSYNPHLSKNHQPHPINQVVHKFYVEGILCTKNHIWTLNSFFASVEKYFASVQRTTSFFC